MDIGNLSNIKPRAAGLILQILFCVIMPGYLFFFIFSPSLFYSLDLFRLTALSTAITMPLFFINSSFTLMYYPRSKNEKQFEITATASAFVGSYFSLVLFFPTIVIGYFDNDMQLKTGVLFILITEVLIIVLFQILRYFRKYDRPKSEQ